ncbi:MAG: MotA/TolQ/ExbB proton channel family protein [Longimicrobiales bacterium]
MMSWFVDGGVIMYPLLIVTIAVVVLVVRSIGRLRGLEGGRRDVHVESGIDAILLWATFALVVGWIGTLVGIGQAADAIMRAGSAPVTLVWAGIKVTLVSTIFGLLVFSLAAPVWFYLRRSYQRRVAA